MNGGLIIVEGNIGAGKSTFARYLADALDGEYLPEPDERSNPYLEDYYRDPARWAFDVQMFLLTRRYRAQRYAQSKVRHNGDGFVVLDRSYYGDVCFANVQKQLGYFSQRDYDTYLCHHTDMKAFLEPPAMAIFLNVSPDICQVRIRKRMCEKTGRACESGISLDYLARLDAEIQTLADSMEGNTLVKRLAWNSDKTNDEIRNLCECFALDIKARKQSVYDFWTGTHGIGDGMTSDLEGLAAREALR